MKLYTAKLSPFAARCRMQIYAKHLDIEFVEYPVGVGKEQIVEMNPMGKIPVLTVGESVLPESDTIGEFLDDSNSDTPLRPDDNLERAQMRLLNRIAELYVFEALSPLFGHLSRKHRDPQVVEEKLALMTKGLQSLERFISGGDFAVGESLSLADCCLVPVLFFVVMYLPYFDVEKPLQPYPKLNDYWTSIQTNEHAARVIQEMTEGIAEKTGKK